jgi:DNA-binding CsgD family transcriptional regulator
MSMKTLPSDRGATKILLHAPAAVERIAVESILARQQRFRISVQSVHADRGAISAWRDADVLVWVGRPFSQDLLAEPAAPRPKTLVALRDITATAAVSSLRAGAAGLACLGCHLDELPQAVDAIAAGHGWLAPCMARVVADHLAGRSRMHASESGSLTARELMVLRSIAGGADNTQVAGDLGIDVRTVRFHASNIYRKLGARHRAEAVALAYRLGLTA